MKPCHLLLVAGLCLFVGACSNETGLRQNHDPYRSEPKGYDDIVVDDRTQKELLISTDPGFGPDHVVMVSVRVPEAYYKDGAIHLTGGRQVHFVPPQSWKTYSGTAMTASEANEVIARARTVDAASDELLASLRALRTLLHDQAVVVENAKADAYSRAELRRSERLVSRNEKELQDAQQRRRRLEALIDDEIKRLQSEHKRLQTQQEKVEAELRPAPAPAKTKEQADKMQEPADQQQVGDD